MYRAWKNPEVLAVVSSIAEVELGPCTDCEIGTVTVSGYFSPLLKVFYSTVETSCMSLRKKHASKLIPSPRNEYADSHFANSINLSSTKNAVSGTQTEDEAKPVVDWRK